MLVDEATGEIRWEIEASDSSTRVAMSPDGRLVAILRWNDEHWKLLDSSNGEVHRVGAKHDGTNACICEVPDSGQRLLQEGCPVVAHTGALCAVAFSPCGQMLATGGIDNTVILWDVEKGGAQQRLQVNAGQTYVCSLSFSANGARLACGNNKGSIHVWSLATGSLLRTIAPPHTSFVRPVHFSPTDSARLVSVCCGLREPDFPASDSFIHLWDVESGELERGIEGGQFAVFAPNGRTIATGGSKHGSYLTDVRVVDSDSGELRVRMVGHIRHVCSAAWSIDGSKLASGGDDGTCKVWDSSTGALLRTIQFGNTTVFSLACGRDWVRDTQRAMAFAMGQHPRLGAVSRVLGLEAGVVGMIVDRV